MTPVNRCSATSDSSGWLQCGGRGPDEARAADDATASSSPVPSGLARSRHLSARFAGCCWAHHGGPMTRVRRRETRSAACSLPTMLPPRGGGSLCASSRSMRRGGSNQQHGARNLARTSWARTRIGSEFSRQRAATLCNSQDAYRYSSQACTVNHDISTSTSPAFLALLPTPCLRLRMDPWLDAQVHALEFGSAHVLLHWRRVPDAVEKRRLAL